ncbi:hypothetical protein MKY29_12015 [Psychrobacillus sp. FSL K6-2365]|uniref:hypothetical protein n=1 Tax=Psychrobacillus sp. FSL K6-2365 TaxID=2921546 RepID=UPI0030F61FF6
MSKLKVNDIPYSQEIIDYINAILDIKLDNKIRYRFRFNARDIRHMTFQLLRQDSFAKADSWSSIHLDYDTAQNLVQQLCNRYGFDWKRIISFEIDLDINSVPIFDLSVYPIFEK